MAASARSAGQFPAAGLAPARRVGRHAVDLKTWADVGRNRMIMLLLLITTLQMSGQFVVFTFMGPLLTKLTQAGPDAVGLVFALLRRVRLRRHCDRDPDRQFLGRLQDFAAVHGGRC